MQTISAILKITGSAGAWATKYGKKAATPEVVVGVAAKLRFDLRSDALDTNLILAPYSAADLTSDAYYLALDVDFDQTTAPKLLISSEVSLVGGSDGETFLDAVLPNTATEGILAALARQKTVTLHGEIGGYSGESGAALADWAIGFDLTLRNRVYLGGTVPEEVTADPEYLTAVQVRALIAEATRSTTPGPAGRDGADGQDGQDGRDGADGADGADGKNAYELAVEAGFEGTVLEWLAGLKGEPGSGLRIDATGELAELHAYDDAPAGFVFAASTVDPSAHTCTKYYYVKASADNADWCDPPLADVTYQQVADVAALAPVEFAAPTGAAEYMAFSLANYPNAWVAAVTIDTQEGELQLPLGSTTGIRKIVKIDGTMRIYFGAACPAFETGKVYLTQFLGLTGSETPATDPGETGTIYYGVITDAELTSVTQITAAHLAGLSSVSAGAVGKTSFGTVPAGSWPVVVVPEGFAAYKDDGFGGLAAFAENNGATGTGANGAAVNGVGKVYGEFKLNTAELYFYVRPVGQV